MAENHKRKQSLKGQGRDDAEIDRGDAIGLVAQKCLSALGGRRSTSDHVLRDRRLGQFEPEFAKFAMDPGRAPERILLAHAADEIQQFPLDLGSPTPISRFPAPIRPKPGPMPAQNRLGSNNLDRAEQAWPPRAGKTHPSGSSAARACPTQG